MNSILEQLTIYQLIAAICLILGKLTGLAAAATIMGMLFDNNFSSLSLFLIISASCFIVLSIIFCGIDYYKQSHPEKRVKKMLSNPTIRKLIEKEIYK